MTTYTLAYWKPAAPTLLPELSAVWNDLFAARWYAKQVQEALARGGEGLAMLEPLAIAALTKYFRSFGSGRRSVRLRIDDADGLAPELVVAHDWLRAIRDKHYQHPVNRFEREYVTLMVAELGTPSARATSVTAGSHSIVGLSSGQAAVLIDLCNFWLGEVRRMQDAESERLLEEAKALSLSELNAMRMADELPSENPFDLR